MAQELSPHKVHRMMALYFQGHTQSSIANRLRINQATVSIYVNRFVSIVEALGLETAAKEFGIMNEVRSLHNLSVELRKARLTAEEAGIGLRIYKTLQRLGIAEKDHDDLMGSLSKMKAEGFINAAVELTRLENTTGMTFDAVSTRFNSTCQRLQETEEKVTTTRNELDRLKSQLASAKQRTQATERDMRARMEKAGVNLRRLEKVEHLALVLKRASIEDSQLEDYIHRMQLLDKSTINLETLMPILEAVAVPTAHDGGKELLDRLSEHGSLLQANKELEATIKPLRKQAKGLEEKAELKHSLETDVARLTAQQARLKKEVADLSTVREDRIKLQKEVKSLTDKKNGLDHNIAEKQQFTNALCSDIEARKRELNEIEEMEQRQASLSASLAEIESSLERRKYQQEILDSFRGLIHASSFDEIQRFVRVLPSLVEKDKQAGQDPAELRDYILETLTGGRLRIMECTSCGVRFSIDKEPKSDYHNYYCPLCGPSLSIHVLRDEAAILKAELARRKPKLVPILRIKPAQTSSPEIEAKA